MLNSLKNIFKLSENETQETNSEDELNLLCGLMLETAQVDGRVDQIEIDRISKTLIEIFQEDQSKVEVELQKSLKEIDEPKSLYSFSSTTYVIILPLQISLSSFFCITTTYIRNIKQSG